MASYTMMLRCFWFLASLLLAALVECDATTTSTVRPYGKLPDQGPLPYILGLPVTISRALHRIHESTRNYRLMDDIWFEVIPENASIDKMKSASKSPPSNLVEQADAVFDTHRLSWHNAIVQGLDLIIYKDHMQRYTFDITRQTQHVDRNMAIQGTRTFGLQRRRMQLVMLPVMYKLGVITTLLIGLTVLSVKGVTIGVLLLVLAVASVVSKLSKHPVHYAGSYAAPPWSAIHEDHYDRVSQQGHQRPDEKNIHVHVHTAPGSASPSSANGHMGLRNSPAYDGQAPVDDNYGPYYWNRNSEEDYYDATAMNNNNNNNNYYNRNNNNNNNNRRLGGNSDAESTTNSPYRWLG